MGRKVFYLLFGGFILFTLISIVFQLFYVFTMSEAWKLQLKNIKIKEGNPSLYFHTVTGGMSGGYERIFLSVDSNLSVNRRPEAYQIYSNELYYKFCHDTLEICIMESFEKPKHPFYRPIIINQARNYREFCELKQKGYVKVSVY